MNEICKLNRNLPLYFPITRRRLRRELPEKTSRKGRKGAKRAKGEEKGYYIQDYRCTSRFILFTIISQTITFPPSLFPWRASRSLRPWRDKTRVKARRRRRRAPKKKRRQAGTACKDSNRGIKEYYFLPTNATSPSSSFIVSVPSLISYVYKT